MPRTIRALVCALAVLSLDGGCRASAPLDTSVSVPDPTITASVKNALAADGTANFKRVTVDTRGGTVTLTGPVDLWAERVRAEDLALKIQGVKRVVNRLQVEPPRPRQ
jgi:hyperosmotically inducible periplasmic protein